MQVNISVDEETTSIQENSALAAYLQGLQVPGVSMKLVPRPPKPGDMGPVLDAITVIVGSSAVVELVRALQVFLRGRRPKVRLTMTDGAKRLSLEAEGGGADAVASKAIETFGAE